MLHKRLFILSLVLGILILAATAISPSVNSSNVVSAASYQQQETQANGWSCPFSDNELRSLHSVYIKDTHTLMLETNDGPIGFDGGTAALEQCRIAR